MDAWFPKDCRQEYARARIRVWTIIVLLMICVVGFGVAQAVRGENYVLFFWVGGVMLMILGSFLNRCPACGSGLFVYGNRCPTWSNGSLRWENGYCHGCGSKVSDAGQPAGELSMVPYITDSSMGDGSDLMKIFEDTPKRFRFRLKRGFLLSTALFLVSLVAWFFLCEDRILDFQRDPDGQINGQLCSSHWGLRLRSRQVTDIRGVKLQDNGGVDPSYRILLETRGGPIPFSNSSSTGFANQQKLVEQMSQFIMDPTKNRGHLILSPSWWAWVITGLFWLLTLTRVVNRPDEFILDRNRRRFQIIRRGMGMARLLEYPLEDIERFGVTRSTEQVNTSGEGIKIECFEIYSIGMRLQTGVVVNLDPPGAARKLDGVGAPSLYRKKRAVANRLEQCRRSLVADSSLAAPGAPVSSPAVEREKLCAVCGASCAQEERYRDKENRYYHQRCYDASSPRPG